jgi:uncharacterized protein YdeI (YjbR/CyaY-like superfamily)
MPEPKPIAKSFSAALTRTGGKLSWVIVHLPFDSAKVWGTRGHLRVKGEINDFAFRSSVFPTGEGGHVMLVNKQMQKGARVQPGMKARFRVEPDLEKREVKVPPELERVLRSSKRLLKFYQSMTPYMRTFIARSVADAKQAETRIRRAEQAAEYLMETMEAEIELPPLLRQAFARNPEAAGIWRGMTAPQRRSQLLGIFYYRTHDSRLRRIEKMIGEMMEKV